MLIKKPADIKSSEITPKGIYLNRRQFMTSASAGLIAGGAALAGIDILRPSGRAYAGEKLANVKKSSYSINEKQNSLKEITKYNNFYELGTDKETRRKRQISHHASLDGRGRRRSQESQNIRHRRPDKISPARGADLSAALRRSLVNGDSLGRLSTQLADQVVEPTDNAKFIQFVTLKDPKRMPGQKGISQRARMALCRGPAHGRSHASVDDSFGRTLRRVLPAQNGAPIRLVVPWKYGFKSIKSIVKVRLVEKQPTAWNTMQPQEYGFYSNVNPEVDHPRWSQASERRIGEFSRRKTLMFNGYAEQVATLYSGMDLKKFYNEMENE